MYTPPDFKEDRLPVLHEAIAKYSFGTLVTSGAQMEATHLPMLLHREEGEFGALYGHFARANPQSRNSAPDSALAIFLGPHAYISPSWYPTAQQTKKVVPTWNYLAVHAHGELSFFEGSALLEHLTELSAAYEGERPAPWSPASAPGDYLEGMLKRIIGFKLAITRLEGKWKMSQNRSPADVAGVIEGLRGENNADQNAVAAIMSELLP